MRVRTRGAHHQKFVVIRHADDPTRDVAYVGGIDLCNGTRDDAKHQGDRQPVDMARAYGPTPAWHDVQVAIQGPAVHDVETTFRERWEDSTPLTLNPGRLMSSLFHREDLSPDPLGDQAPPPPPRPDGHEIVQIVRTFPVIYPKSFDFAPNGERSVMLGNTKAIANAERLVYVEDQYLWSEEVGEHFAGALRAKPDLRLVVVLPIVPDREGAAVEMPQLYGRSLAMRKILEAGGDRVAVFGLTNDSGHAGLRALEDLHHRPPLGERRLGQPQPPVVDQRQRDRLRRRRRARRRSAPRPPRTRSRGCCCARWSPSTSAATRTRCRRTRTSSSTRWCRARTRSTSGTPSSGRDRRTGVRGLVADKLPRRPVPVPESVSRSIPGRAYRRRRVQDRAAAFAAAIHDQPAAPGSASPADHPRAHRHPAAVGAAAVRPAVRPGRPPATGRRELRWARTWNDDPRDLIRVGEDFDLDAMERAATPGWKSGKKAAERFCQRAR